MPMSNRSCDRSTHKKTGFLGVTSVTPHLSVCMQGKLQHLRGGTKYMTEKNLDVHYNRLHKLKLTKTPVIHQLITKQS